MRDAKGKIIPDRFSWLPTDKEEGVVAIVRHNSDGTPYIHWYTPPLKFDLGTKIYIKGDLPVKDKTPFSIDNLGDSDDNN